MSSNTDQADVAGVASASDLEADNLLDDALGAMFDSADDGACGGPSKTADTTASRAAEQPAAKPFYDPADYQRPHPDDRGGSGSKKPTKHKGKGRDSPPPELCGWCGKQGAKRRCTQCKSEVYCGEECQRVSVRACPVPLPPPPPPPPPPPVQRHWKHPTGHKKTCLALVLAVTVQSQLLRDSQKAFEAEQCLICLAPPTKPTTLPCGHTFCTECVAELRKKGVADVCPLCRKPLPPGAEKLYELAGRVWAKIIRAVGSNTEWPPLTSSQQKDMDGAIVMLQEAMDQGE